MSVTGANGGPVEVQHAIPIASLPMDLKRQIVKALPEFNGGVADRDVIEVEVVSQPSRVSAPPIPDWAGQNHDH